MHYKDEGFDVQMPDETPEEREKRRIALETQIYGHPIDRTDCVSEASSFHLDTHTMQLVIDKQ